MRVGYLRELESGISLSLKDLAEVESINVVKCRVLLHNRKFERFSGANTFTNTHDMLVAVGQNMCGVPVWT